MHSNKSASNAMNVEDVLQAVLLADDFTERLAPYCIDTPLSLVPLVNVPLIDHALEYLEASGINECFIYLCKYPDAVKAHLSAGRWLTELTPMTIHVQTAEDCFSLGDVMRDVDAKALIQSDFLLMSVDCITNADVAPIIRMHSARRRSEDRGAVLTLLYRPVMPAHPGRAGCSQLLLAADAASGLVRHHQRVRRDARGVATLPLHIFQGAPAVEVRYDLLDPGMCVCAPTVPQLFADNFDFQTRDHFVRGILINEEIMNNTIYYHSLGDAYAAQINSLNALLSVTRDVLDRWAYPVVPEMRAPSRTELRCNHRNVYRHKTAKVGSGSRLVGTVALAADVEVGRDCRLSRCVLAAGCQLGNGVVLQDALLGAGCRLGDRVRVKRAVLGAGVTLGDDVTLEPGCVLASGVHVRPLYTLPAGTLLVAVPPDHQFGDDAGEHGPALQLVGDGGCGFVYTAGEQEDELTPAPLGEPEPEPSDSEPSSESEAESSDEERTDGGSPVPDDTSLFYNEVLDSLVRGYNEKIGPENLILEVNSSKFAYNVTVQELNTLLVKAMLSVPDHGRPAPLEPAGYMTQLLAVLNTFLPLLGNYIKTPEAERSCLTAIETYSYGHAALTACLTKVLMLLYRRDVLSEVAILAWYGSGAECSAKVDRARQQVRQLVEWLQQADEESDSS